MMPHRWEVWLVDMPFEEGIGSKIRPALVVDPQNSYVIVGKMTSLNMARYLDWYFNSPEPRYIFQVEDKDNDS